MVEPEMPFACTMPDCGMTFTNEDHLNVHTRKHDMVLQFGSEQKAAFVADQTPTPTRFIRNCEEVGLFQDLQNVNPFDEGFKRAIETKQGILSLDHSCTSEELHTPQMFPLLDPGDCVFTTNNQRNITISRSSSDETGAVKEFETTRISKLTNEVTTISRIVEKHEDTPKHKETLKNSVSYTNNVIKIQSNVEIRKDSDIIEDVVIKDGVINKDVKNAYDILQLPIMSQKSIDLVVDSLTTDFASEKGVKDGTTTKIDDKKETVESKTDVNNPNKEVLIREIKDNYEVILKLPSGQQIKLINADEKAKNTKDLLKKAIKEKAEGQKNLRGVNFHMVPTLTCGTLIPVTIVNTNLVNTSLVNTNLTTTGFNTTSTRLLNNTNLVKTNLVNTNLVSANLVSSVAPTNLVNTVANTSLVNATLVNSNLVNTNLVNANLVPNVAPTSLVNTIANTSLVNATLVNTNLVNTNLVNTNLATTTLVNGAIVNTNYTPKLPLRVFDKRPVRRKIPDNINNNGSKKSKEDRISDLESRSAASKRYRKKLKETMEQQALENKQLKEINEKLIAEKALLQTVILDHMKTCPCPDALRDLKEKLKDLNFKTNL